MNTLAPVQDHSTEKMAKYKREPLNVICNQGSSLCYLPNQPTRTLFLCVCFKWTSTSLWRFEGGDDLDFDEDICVYVTFISLKIGSENLLYLRNKPEPYLSPSPRKKKIKRFGFDEKLIERKKMKKEKLSADPLCFSTHRHDWNFCYNSL